MLYRQQRRRSGIPMISLVGYTNTGKSTLLNTLSRAEVAAEDKLFATLDPTTRRLTLPDKSVVLLSDTVGFIRKLPPMVVTAFRATLEEITEADLLLHIVDLSSTSAAEQCRVVEDILKDMEIAEKPRVTVLNKIDLLLDSTKNWDEKEALAYLHQKDENVDENTVMVSAAKGWGLDKLLKTINQAVKRAARADSGQKAKIDAL